MRFMLDTNICIYLIKRKPRRVLERLCETEFGEVGVSSITLSELEYGVCRSVRPEQNRVALTKFLASLEIAPYDQDAAAKYGELRAILERKGRPIGPLDLLIAAHALALNCVLVTNNTREFRRAPGLVLENWTVARKEHN